ncbi:AAA family ATPase [Methylomonas rosea]|uniref:AAA family ATPase n=1 Tax=Methylomonas rosea TaxID=2952227 RepID=A0ABT1TN94_9GAMM|nr:AAA family ATPase [Methylomonas sp. WSC-7]MCQ8116233.1 AAA family ATPase [Methylomonas sp. WSC-7]
MKLKNLQITNFRCFASLSIDLDKQLTVLVAKNGQGKSSVLDAIRIGLWPFVRGFDLARNPASDTGNNISVDDVRILKMRDRQLARQLPCSIALKGDWNINLVGFERFSKTWEWARIRESEAKGTKTKDKLASKLIKILASIAQAQVRNPESPDTDLPILGYYGTGRLWSQKRLTEAKSAKKNKQNADSYMRLFAYRDCLDPSSSYKHFAEWFAWIFESYREDQIMLAEKGFSPEADSLWKNTIQVIQQAIDSVLLDTGWYKLEYSISHEKSLVLNHEQHGILKVELLSDGIRGVLAMVGDIAYRCIKLNPHLGLHAIKETYGIVMIDEVDMHLHPAWQQTILGSLTMAFPKIQFIVTTHSPQVISTVPSHQIRILDGNNVYSAEAGTQGAEASRILKRIFGVDPRPKNDPNTKLLTEYLDLVYADKWKDEEAITMRTKLDAIYQGNEPELTKADLYIENRQWEQEIEESQ